MTRQRKDNSRRSPSQSLRVVANLLSRMNCCSNVVHKREVEDSATRLDVRMGECIRNVVVMVLIFSIYTLLCKIFITQDCSSFL